jgi:hypothetical protein
MKNAFFALIFMLLGLCSSDADDWQRADVYFIDWDNTTRIALTPGRVRQLADYKHTFRNDAPAVARLLQLSRLKPVKNKRPEDARVVIDLTDDTLRVHTYYASRFNLCSADNRLKHEIDEQFRRRIARLAKQHKTN